MRRRPRMCPDRLSLSDPVLSIVSMALCELVSVGSELIQPPAWHTNKLRDIYSALQVLHKIFIPLVDRADSLTTETVNYNTTTIYSQFSKLHRDLSGGYWRR